MDLKEFLTKLKDDEALRQEINACEKAEDAYAIAKGAGLDIPFEDFEKFLTKSAAAYTSLSDDELALVSGGLGSTTGDIIVSVIVGVTELTCV